MVVVTAIAWRGGYGQDARAVVAALAGVAALITFGSGRVELPRSAVVWTLAGLALLSAASAAWTIGSAGAAVRDGAATLALAAVVLIAATLRPLSWHAWLLLVAAVALATVGLIAAVGESDPLALQICDSWRPAGPFEYPPTLALVSAGALPVALRVAGHATAGARALGGASAWLLGFTIASTANRTTIALGGLALVAAVWLGSRGGLIALAVIGASTASALIIGNHLGDASALRLIAVAVMAALPTVLAVRAGRHTDSDQHRGHGPAPVPRRRVWTAAVMAAALAATALATVADAGSGCQGDASHGRVGIWRAAVDTARDRPIQGFGSSTFLAASRDHQLERRPRPTRFAHNQILETWVELGMAGAALVLAWLAATAVLLWQTRRTAIAPLLAPAVAAFPLATLLDWPWHLLGAGMLWAVAAGGLVAARSARPRS